MLKIISTFWIFSYSVTGNRFIINGLTTSLDEPNLQYSPDFLDSVNDPRFLGFIDGFTPINIKYALNNIKDKFVFKNCKYQFSLFNLFEYKSFTIFLCYVLVLSSSNYSDSLVCLFVLF